MKTKYKKKSHYYYAQNAVKTYGIAKRKQNNNLVNKRQKDEEIGELYRIGGKAFVNDVRLFGCTYKDDVPLDLTIAIEQLCLIIGDCRISNVCTTGPAQCGKTLSHTMLIAWLIINVGLDCGWFYAQHSSLNANVPDQFRPLAEQWCDRVEATGKKVRRRGDRKTNERYQFGKAVAIFSHANSQGKSREGKAAVGNAGVSFTANWLFNDEFSQWPNGVNFAPRLTKSIFETRPNRDIGTPGSGAGIEAKMKDVERLFYPHYRCPSCGVVAPLDPKGCLLRLMSVRSVTGKESESYLSQAGRPIESGTIAGTETKSAGWWHKDPQNPVESAYIACSHCGHELSNDVRVKAWLQCLITGQTAPDYSESLAPGIPNRLIKVAVKLSPLAVRSSFNLASQIIEQGLGISENSISPDDWQQQVLGHPSESQSFAITPKILDVCINAPRPGKTPDLIVGGCDQGTGEDWLWITDVYLPKHWEWMSIVQACRKSIKNVRFASDVKRSEVIDICLDHEVDRLIYDNEPDRTAIADLCQDWGFVEMADQSSSIRNILTLGKVKSGATEYDCWMLNNSQFHSRVLEAYLEESSDGFPTIRLPKDWIKWRSMMGADKSPYRHLCAVKRDPYNGRWNRPKDHKDDLWFAQLMSEVALHLEIENKLETLREATKKNESNVTYRLNQHVSVIPWSRA